MDLFNIQPDITLEVNHVTQMIKFGNCMDLLKQIPSESVTLVVTSPPYDLDKDYGEYKDRIGIDNWKIMMADVSKEIFRILKPNGSFFLNVSPVPEKKTKEIIPLQAVSYEIIKEVGFSLRNMITWHFNNMVNCTNRLSGRYENILWCVKDINSYIFNLDDIRLPYITKNDKRLDQSCGRNPTDVWNFDAPESDFWYFNRVNNMTKKKLNIEHHPCVFPTPMIDRIIKMSSHKSDWILDPFVGTGTTLVSAAGLGRNCIGIELNPIFGEAIRSRLTNEVNSQSSSSSSV